MVVGLLLALIPSVFAQTRDLGSIRGTVNDSSGAVIPGASVAVKNVSLGFDRNAVTDAQGVYSFSGLPLTGEYIVTASAPRFQGPPRPGIELRADEVAVVNVTLYPAAANVDIGVNASEEGVDSSSSQIDTGLDLQKIENTPVLGNKFTSLALLDSSVRPSTTTGDIFTNQTLIVVNGGGRRQTSYAIDNTTADDSWGRQTILTSLPFASVQEYTVVTNASSAEYGRTSGSAVNVVTKSGTNTFHGDFLGMGRPAFSQANAPLATMSAVNTLSQGSGAFSGPLIKDRTYFMLSAEYTNQDRDAVITSPKDPGDIFTGNFAQALFLARIDHKFSDRNRLAFRANLDRFLDSNPQDGVSGLNLPSTARTFVKHAYAAALSDTATIGDSLVNEARVQWQLASPVTEFLPQQPSPQVSMSGNFTFGDSRFANLANHQYEQADTLSWMHGRHTIKGGVDLIESSSGGFGQEFGSGFLLGQWALNNPATCNYATLPISTILSSLQANTAAPPQGAICTGAASPLVNTYTQSFGNLSYNILETNWAAFVQDDFRPSNDLTLNLGVRYEGQIFVGDNNNFSPRAGFVWRLPHTTSTVLRGGYGIFSSEIRTDLAAGYLLGGPTGIFTFSATPGKCGFPTTFGPWTSFTQVLQSPACTAPGGAATVPIRDITIKLGDSAFLNQFINTSALRFYPSHLRNPYTQQWNLGIEHEIAPGWIFSADYVGSHSVKLERPVDLNSPAVFVRTLPTQTRSVAAANATRPLQPTGACTTTSASFNPIDGNCLNNFRQILAIVNIGSASYNGAQLKLNKRFSQHFSALLTYTWSHAIGTVEPDAANQNANDWNLLGADEKATSVLDQRHRAALSGWYKFPLGFVFGANAQLASGFPYNVTIGTDVNGDGANADRPVLCGEAVCAAGATGAVIPRNFGRGTAVFDVATSLAKNFHVTERLNLSLRAEVYNLFNHSNFYGRNGTFGTGAAAPPATFGTALGGLANAGPGRQMQFMARLQF